MILYKIYIYDALYSNRNTLQTNLNIIQCSGMGGEWETPVQFTWMSTWRPHTSCSYSRSHLRKNKLNVKIINIILLISKMGEKSTRRHCAGERARFDWPETGHMRARKSRKNNTPPKHDGSQTVRNNKLITSRCPVKLSTFDWPTRGSRFYISFFLLHRYDVPHRTRTMHCCVMSKYGLARLLTYLSFEFWMCK